MLITFIVNVVLAPVWMPAWAALAVARSFMDEDDFHDVFGPDHVEDVLA